MTNATERPRSVLLYDGECGFCARSVQFVLEREPHTARSLLAFAPLQGQFGTELRGRFPELAGVDSVVWYDQADARVSTHSTAALAVLTHLGGIWAALAVLARLVPCAFRDMVYRQIAHRRFDIASRACLLPSPEERTRFLP